MERKEQVARIGKAFEELVKTIADTANDIKGSIVTKVRSITELKTQINQEYETLIDISVIADNAVEELADFVEDMDSTTEVVAKVLNTLGEVPNSIEVVDEDFEEDEEVAQ